MLIRVLPRCLCLMAAAMIVGCGGGDGKDVPAAAATVTGALSSTPEASPAPAGATYTSDDGKLSLFVPDGAVPAGTDVSITAVPHDDLPPELAQLAGSGTGYLLEPAGLTFSTPATATLTLNRGEIDPEDEGAQTAYALVSFNETAGREVLDSETTWTVGDEALSVSAEIAHFSWLTRTKGSLHATLDGHLFHRNVGATYGLGAQLQLARGDIVALTGVELTWLASGVITLSSAPTVAIGDIGGAGGIFRSADADYVCSQPGAGTDGFNVRATSTVIELPDLVTTLGITIQEPVDCVEGTLQPEPTAFPSATPSVRTTVHLVQTIGCEHTQPGVQSKLLKKGRLTDSAGLPLKGTRVSEEANGPGLLDADQSVTSLSVETFTDENGEFTLEWPINKFGTYTVTALYVVLSGDRLAVLDETSTTSSTYTVSQVCTPP